MVVQLARGGLPSGSCHLRRVKRRTPRLFLGSQAIARAEEPWEDESERVNSNTRELIQSVEEVADLAIRELRQDLDNATQLIMEQQRAIEDLRAELRARDSSAERGPSSSFVGSSVEVKSMQVSQKRLHHWDRVGRIILPRF